MIKILIVEDEKNIRETLKEMLSMNNYQVITASDGLEGFDSIIKNKPTIVLSDVNMPGLNGFELLDKVNKHFNSASTAPSFIFISARITNEDRREGMQLGAEDYLFKPFTIKDVLDTIEVKLKKRESLEQATVAKERNRISQDLHDSIQQTFIGVLYSFNRLEDKLTDAKSQEIFEESISLLRSGIRELREVSKILSSLSPDLISNIKQAVNRISGLNEMKIKIINSVNEKIIDTSHLDAFRIFQETMNNVLKYSNAEEIVVSIKSIGSTYSLDITDNGIGFDVATMKKNSGLTNMKNRASKLNGTLKIESKVGKGTSITLIFPKNHWV